MRSRWWWAGLLLLAVTGCSSDAGAEPGAGASSGTSDSVSASADPSATASSSAPTSPPSPPAVEPATGRLLTITGPDGPALRFRLPEGDWMLSSGGEAGNLYDPDAGYLRIDSAANPSFDVTLDDAADQAVGNEAGEQPRVRRTANRTIAGVEGYVAEGRGPAGLFYEFGATYGDSVVRIDFRFDTSSATTRGYVESVLATVEWL